MATISKFYFHDVTSPNTGTMPSNSPATQAGGVVGAGTEASGASTARDATDVIGVLQTSSTITAAATSGVLQRLGHRRFVSRPLAAQTLTAASGNWTHSYARTQSNTNHNTNSSFGPTFCSFYAWRPSTAALVSSVKLITATKLTVAVETTDSVTGSGFDATLIDGDILVFDMFTEFNQGMATAYTDSFFYDGTTEASATTCASFVTPPVALTLFLPSGVPSPPAHPFDPIPFIT